MTDRTDRPPPLSREQMIELEHMANGLIADGYVTWKKEIGEWIDEDKQIRFTAKHNIALFRIAQLFGQEKAKMYKKDGSFWSETDVLFTSE